MCVQNFIKISARVWISISPPHTNRQSNSGMSIFIYRLAEVPGTAWTNLQPEKHLLFCKQFQRCVLQLIGFQAPPRLKGGGGQSCIKTFLGQVEMCLQNFIRIGAWVWISISVIFIRVTADYYYPDWGCLIDCILKSVMKNCWLGWRSIETTTLDLNSQSGAFDQSATTIPYKCFTDINGHGARVVMWFQAGILSWQPGFDSSPG